MPVTLRRVIADDTEQQRVIISAPRVDASTVPGAGPYLHSGAYDLSSTRTVTVPRSMPLRFVDKTEVNICVFHEAAGDEEEFPSELSGELPGGYRLLLPLRIHVWRELDEFIAEQPDIRIHSFGPSPEAALSELKAALVEHRDRLEDLGGRLSPALRQERDLLRGLIVPHA